ncbi:integrase, catalytic region, zinc finger, CCHC-type containing protein, partial [Tanacetum coccineum]
QEEQQDFLADSLEDLDSDCDDLQLHTISIFKADHVDAFDSDFDEAPTTSAIFMERLSHAGSIDGDTVCLTYNSDILFKVPHYNSYHETDMLNLVVQETKYSKHVIYNNDSYDELTSDNNVISYPEYMVTIENDVAQSVPPPAQDNAMILFVIEQMQSQVERRKTVNQENKSVNDSLTSELERYKEKVKVLEERQKYKEFFTEREKHLDSQMRGIIVDHNKKVEAFEKQVITQKQQFEIISKKYSSMKDNFKTLKKELKDKQDKYNDEILVLEKDKKKLQNIVYKMGQTVQTMHMLTKHQAFYDDAHKTAIGYQNPLFLRIAQRINLFAQRIQELLVYVNASCPFTQSGNEKWAYATSHKKNNKPYADTSGTSKAIINNIQKYVAKQNIQRTNNPMLPSIGKTGITHVIAILPGQILTTTMTLIIELSKQLKSRYDQARKSLTRAFINSNSHKLNENELGLHQLHGVQKNHPNLGYLGIVEIVLWYLDFGCSKHMTRQRDKLNSFVSKFIGLGYNLFSIGQFCDSDLEVAFRKHTCFLRNLEGVDLLSRSCGSNIYTISIDDMMNSSPMCLLSKALKTKYWLWHRRLSHLNFGTINQLAKEGLVKGLPKMKYAKEHLCSTCQLGNSKKELLKPKPEPSTNDRLQMLHMDLCGPMRVESINKKSSGSVLQPVTSREISSELVPNQTASTSSKPPSKNDLDLLFQPRFDEYFKPSPSDVSPISSAATLPQDTTEAFSSTIIDRDAPFQSTTTNTETTTTLIQSTNVEEPNDENNDAEFNSDTFINPFAPPVTSSAKSSSSRIVDTSNMHTFQQPQTYIKRWTKDHPLVTIIRIPSKLVSTRRQLAIDAMWCYFHAFLTKVDPKNYKEAMK